MPALDVLTTFAHTLHQEPQPAAEDPPVVEMPQCLVKIPAGFPSPAADYLDDALDLNAYLVPHKAASFFFTVEGVSMIRAGIWPGDKVAVDRSIEARHDDIVIAVVDGEFTLKRLYRQGGVVELRAENPRYAPIRFKEGEELTIWGVVTGLVRKYRP